MGLIDQAGRAAATTHYVMPPQDLAPLVAEAWIQRYTDAIRTEPRTWRVVADHQAHLIVHRPLGNAPRGARVVGARSTWLDVPVAGRAWSAGVTLRPGVLPLLTGLPASDFTDGSASPEDVWGRQGAELRDAIGETGTAAAVIGVLVAFIRMRAAGSLPAIDWRVRSVSTRAAASTAPAVAGLAAHLGVSTRTLRNIYGREVGISPREALSIGRLHGVVGRALAGSYRNGWSRLALASGFYDQAHLIRDFHRFLGETPESFLARGAPMAV